MKNYLFLILIAVGLTLSFNSTVVSLSLIEKASFTVPDISQISSFYMKDIDWDGHTEILVTDEHQVLLYSYRPDRILNSFRIQSEYGFSTVDLLLEDITRDGVAEIVVGTFDTFGKCRIMIAGLFPIGGIISEEYIGNQYIFGSDLLGLIELKVTDINQDGFKELFISYDSSYWNKDGYHVTSEVSGITKCYYSFPDSLLVDNHSLMTDVIEYSDGQDDYLMAVVRSGSHEYISSITLRDQYYEIPVLLNPGELFKSQLLNHTPTTEHQNKEYAINNKLYSSIRCVGNLITTMPGAEFLVTKHRYSESENPTTIEDVNSYAMYNVQSDGLISEVWEIIESNVPSESDRPLAPVYHPQVEGSYFGFMNTSQYSENQLYRFNGADGSIIDTIGEPVEGEKHWVYPFDDKEPYLATINGTTVTLYKLAMPTDADGGEGDIQVPSQFSIGQPYPNPFNATQTIPITVMPGREVKVELYNLLGQKIETLFSGRSESSEMEIIWNAEHIASGVYFIKATSGEQTDIVKTVLLK